MKKHKAILPAFVTTLAIITALALPLHAGESKTADAKETQEAKNLLQTPAAQSDWQFSLGLPLWVAGLSGDVGVKNVSTNVDFTAKQLLKHLKATLAIAGEVRYRQFGLYADFLYLKFNAGGSTAGLEAKQFLGDIDANYRFVENDRGWIDGLAGLRITGVDQELNFFSILGPFSPKVSGSRTWVDPYLGLRGRVNINKAFYFTAKSDVGGFDTNSKITVEAYGAFGCQVTRYIYSEVGYKYLYDDYHKDGVLWKTSTAGLMMTMGLRF